MMGLLFQNSRFSPREWSEGLDDPMVSWKKVRVPEDQLFIHKA